MNYGTGLIHDSIATHDGNAGAFLTSLPSASKRPAAYLDAIGGVRSQGPTSTCVGFAFASAIALRCAALGIQVPRGSEIAIRSMAAMLAEPGKPLSDDGCQPSLAVKAIREFGLPSTPLFDESKVCDPVTLGELEDADKRIRLFVKEFRGIDDTGNARIEQVNWALNAGLPVPLAVSSAPAWTWRRSTWSA